MSLQRSDFISRFSRFLRRPLHEQAKWAVEKARGLLRNAVPVRLPFGALWILRRDHLGGPVLAGEFEVSELAFVERFIQRGMTVLDVGAHHGLYTLLASKQAGRQGRVFAFEPSPRERRALSLHVALNGCLNVKVEPFAVGKDNGEADLFLVTGEQTGCNSLRMPVVHSATVRVPVRVVRLDDWLIKRRIDHIHFVKLDVEGAELAALEGGNRLFTKRPRPVLLVEVQDIRTEPWGYPARRILECLAEKQYVWLSLIPGGALKLLDVTAQEFEGNFVACPEELMKSLTARFQVIAP